MEESLFEKVIMDTPEGVLIGVVMALTGGSANPAVVGSQIRNWRVKIGERQKQEQSRTSIDRPNLYEGVTSLSSGMLGEKP